MVRLGMTLTVTPMFRSSVVLPAVFLILEPLDAEKTSWQLKTIAVASDNIILEMFSEIPEGQAITL